MKKGVKFWFEIFFKDYTTGVILWWSKKRHLIILGHRSHRLYPASSIIFTVKNNKELINKALYTSSMKIVKLELSSD